MSFYNQAITTRILDANYNKTKSRTVFRLTNNKVFLANMRLINLGVTTNADNDELTAICGAYGVIKNIQLISNNQVIDQLQLANVYQAFLQQAKPNGNIISMEKYTAQNNIGLSVNPNGDNPPTSNIITQNSFAPKTKTDENKTPLGWLSLQQVFPFLKASQYFPTTKFKNCSIVIEYETDVSNITRGGTIKNTVEPNLIVDELQDDNFVSSVSKSYKPPVWTAIEYDRLHLKANEASVKGILKGFRGKYLQKILIVNSETNNANDSDGTRDLYSKLGSKYQNKQVIQLVVNGSNLFTGDGIDRDSKRLAYLTDTFGTQCKVSPFSGIGNNDASEIVNKALLGNTDYTGFFIGKTINTLELHFQRTIPVPPAHKFKQIYCQALNLNIFGYVPKTIAMNQDGSFNTVYVNE